MTTTLKYLVRDGDTYGSISENLKKAKGLTTAALEKANASRKLFPKVELIVPGTDVDHFRYTVQPGQGYWAIATGLAKCAGVTVQQIEAANKAYKPKDLIGGKTVLEIPYYQAPPQTAPITVKNLTPENEANQDSGPPAFTQKLNIENTTLADLKQMIAQHFHIPVASQILGTHELSPLNRNPGDDAKPLKAFKIGLEGATIGVIDHTYQPAKGNPPADYKIVNYYIAWGIYDRKFYPTGIDYSLMTHLNYAFADVRADGTVFLPEDAKAQQKGLDEQPDTGNLNAILEMKKRYANRKKPLKTLLSIGGFSYSDNFSAAAATDESRLQFARTAHALMQKFQMDGIDIDWEFPVAGGRESVKHDPMNDAGNFSELIKTLRSTIGNDALITIAASPRPIYLQNLEIEQLTQKVGGKSLIDWVNLMAYDYHGPWADDENTFTNFNSPLYAAQEDPSKPALKHDLNIDAAVRTLLSRGLPKKQLVMGLSLYGRGFAGVKNENGNKGLYQPYWKALPEGTWKVLDPKTNTYVNSGVYDWWHLHDKFLNKGDWQEYYHNEAQAAWLYSPNKEIFISFDNPRTIWNKCAYVVARELGGVMCWDASSDRYNHLLFIINYTLTQGGLKVSGGPIPKSGGAGTSWPDPERAGKYSQTALSGLSFALTPQGIVGIQTTYNGDTGPWHGSSKGRIANLEIPQGMYISQMDIQTAATGVTFQGFRIHFDNKTSFTVGSVEDMQPQYSLGAESSALCLLSGKATADQLTELNCDFHPIPSKAPTPFVALQNAPAGSTDMKIAANGKYYVDQDTITITQAEFDKIEAHASNKPAKVGFKAGCCDASVHADANGQVKSKVGIQFKSKHSVLWIGDPDEPVISVDYDGPTIDSVSDDEISYKHGNAKAKVSAGFAKADLEAGNRGITVDSSLAFKFKETFEIDADHFKVGAGGKGFEINSKQIGVYVGLGPLFSIHIPIIRFDAFEKFGEMYVNVGKGLWKLAATTFSPFAKAAGFAYSVIKDIFKSIF